MNNILLEAKRDFPFTTNVLKFMQAAFSNLEKLALLGGDNYIVEGCVVTGTDVSSGWVVLNGLLMPFTAGTKQSTIKIVKTETEVTVDLGTRTEITYHAEFGTTATPGYQFDWDDVNSRRLSERTIEKVIDIGVWDMEADATKLIDLDVVLPGVEFKDILAVDASIFPDDDASGDIVYDLKNGGSVAWGAFPTAGQDHHITLYRHVGGGFDGAYFNDNAINRGKVLIKYING
jgi:hypothetical protein